MHPAIIEAWLNDMIAGQLPPSLEPPTTTQSLQPRCLQRDQRHLSLDISACSKCTLSMNDGSPMKQPRRSQRSKASGTPTSTAQQLPMRPPLTKTASPIKRSDRRTSPSQSSASLEDNRITSDQSLGPDPEATPRASKDSASLTNASTVVTSAQYSKSISDHHTIFDPPAFPSSRSSTSKQSSTSRRSASPLKNMASLREAGIVYDDLKDNGALLGDAGDQLYQDLAEISMMIGIYPAEISEDILDAIGHKHRIHQLHKNTNDHRSRSELLHELSEIQTIKQLSRRCSRDMEGEAEWNNAVHSAVLRLALGSDNSVVGWRYITSAKIDSRYLPLMSDGLSSSSKMVDYALFIGDAEQDSQDKAPLSWRGRLDERISRFVREWSDSINHISYVALRHRPIYLGIETKTISRTEEEARVQLGIWVTAHIKRILSLSSCLSISEADKLKQTLQEMVFPLIYVQSAKWSLLFARPFFKRDARGDDSLEIIVYHDINLGETSSIDGIYQLLQAFRVLRMWGDSVFRAWWGNILDIISE